MSRYSAKQKKMRGIRRGGRKFLQLYTNVKRSRAYHGLNCYARALLFELIDRFNGCNNGMIGLGCREASHELGCGTSTVSRAMRQLDDSGLARPLTPGVWRGKRATEWRLMFLRCDKTGELPVSNWEQREPYSECRSEDTKVPLGVRNEPLSAARGTQKPNSSMNDSDLSAATSTHIDIYQGYGVAEGGTEADPDESLRPSPEGPKGCSKKFGPSDDERIDALGRWGNNAKRRQVTP